MKVWVHVQKYNNGERARGREEGGINRVNDKKEQCCDSKQLVFPNVDGPSLVCVCVCVHAHLIETDCLVIVHFCAGLRS